MKITLSWLKQHLDTEAGVQEIGRASCRERVFTAV